MVELPQKDRLDFIPRHIDLSYASVIIIGLENTLFSRPRELRSIYVVCMQVTMETNALASKEIMLYYYHFRKKKHKATIAVSLVGYSYTQS